MTQGPVTSDVADRSRWRPWGFGNWSIRSKLLGVIVLPVVAALVAGVLLVTGLRDTATSFASIARVSEAQRASLDLIGELNREEFIIAAAVAGIDVSSLELPTREDQIRRTDSAANRLRELSGGVFEEGTAIDDPVLAINASLDLVDSFRASNAVGEDATDIAAVAGPYDAAANSTASFSERLTELVSDQELRGGAVTAQTLAGANRQSVSEAVLLLAVALDPEAVPSGDVAAAEAARSEAVEDFQLLVGFSEERRYRVATRDNDAARQPRIERAVDDTPGSDAASIPELGPPAEYVEVVVAADRATTDLRDQLSADQLAAATDAQRSATNRTTVLIVVVLTLLLLGIVITVLAIRAVSRPLRALQAGALDVAMTKLPLAIARIRDGDTEVDVDPVDVHTVEEAGQVARAVDVLHQQAVRLAGEQEQLRRNVNDILVNLSRRSQGLLGRQLSLIDRLENAEANPDQLSQLFRLDHLASRMRRNNDNLMVLAGAGGTQSSKPLPVLDVVRAAVSETEEYERIDIEAVQTAVVSASVALDLVHLVAELLDNATSFSPPTSRVTVGVQADGDIGLVMTIIDRGVGIEESTLAELNRKLTDTPVVDSSVPRKMGLFVVSRLAQRHRLTVRLRHDDDTSGVAVDVTIPSAVLVDALVATEPTDRSPEPAPARPPAPPTASRTGGHAGATRLGHQPGARRDLDRRPRPTPAPVGTPPPSDPLTTSGGPPQESPPPVPEEATPIFQEMSAWFSGFDATLAALSGPAADVPTPRAAPDGPHGGAPTPMAFVSGADDGWRAVQAVEADAADEVTAVGLPRRRPKANLVPGSALPTRPATEQPDKPRDARALRSRLASFHDGVRTGRTDARTNTHPDGSPPRDTQR